MSKNTWVNVNDTWKKVGNVWLNVEGVWKQKVVPKGIVSSLWKEFMQYFLTLYDNGKDYYDFYSVFKTGGGVLTKYPTYMSTTSYNNGSSSSHIITTSPTVDLTSYSKLYIDWHVTAYNGANPIGINNFDVGIKLNHEMFSPFAAYTRIRLDNTNRTAQRQISSLDISGFTGEYYPSVSINKTSAVDNTQTEVKIYKMWIE